MLKHRHSVIGKAWNQCQTGCFHSPLSQVLFFVINSSCLVAELWHCWPCATHSCRVVPWPAAGREFFHLSLLLSSALCRTFPPVTLFQCQIRRHIIALSETNNLSFRMTSRWSCLLYCNDTKFIKWNERFTCLCRSVL